MFPLSNWTELDIWEYIYHEGIPVVPLYFAQTRPVVVRPGMILMVDDDRCRLLPKAKRFNFAKSAFVPLDAIHSPVPLNLKQKLWKMSCWNSSTLANRNGRAARLTRTAGDP